jgi:hypothetical protein
MQDILLDIVMVCVGILSFFYFNLEKRIKRLENDLQRDK